jgi:hypothetical protein
MGCIKLKITICDVISFSLICKPCIGGARGSCGTGGCIVVLGLDVLRNGCLCTGYLGALSCVLFTLCCVLLKCA